MIKLKRIVFGFSEAAGLGNQVFSGFAAANEALSRARLKAPTLGYNKTDFTLEYEDGETYSGRYDVGRDNFDTLQMHVRQFCECYGRIKKPANLTEEQWKSVATYPEYAEFLNKYEL
jgi:hypothetical protein